MPLTLRTQTETERRHDRPHRTSLGERRPANRLNGTRAHARNRVLEQPEGGRVLPLASPPPSRGRGAFSDSDHSPAIWREMMSRWMSDVPS